MKNRCSFALMALVLISLVAPTLSFAQNQGRSGTGGGAASPNRSSSGGSTSRRGNARGRGLSEVASGVSQDFAEALSVIHDNYVDGNKLDYNAVFKSSIIGMLRSLDPHSNFYDRQEFEELKTDQRSEYYGIGASIGNQRIGDQTDTYIIATFENSPAARAGLRFGDKVVKVDGVEMAEKTSLEVRDKIRGPRGSVVRLTVERASTGRSELVEIRRDAVAQPSVPDAYLLNPTVGYVDMTHGFNYTTADELDFALEYLRDRGMTSLVLDLRNNPGGLLEQAIRVSEKFLPSGEVILTQKGRNGLGDRTYRAENSTPTQVPIVLLINGNSASASEIVAGALQDHDRAILVGESSFGKGLVQSINNLEYGAGLTLTTAKYYTPSGRLIQRDYSNGSTYDYLRGALREGEPQKPTGPESRTDMGRLVYGGDGIAPDVAIKPRTVTTSQARLLSPIFAFTRELVNGRITGFDAYKIQRAVDFNHRLQMQDFPVTDAVFRSLKEFVAKDSSMKSMATQLDRNRAFVELQLRYYLITAAYGRVTADQVLIQDDPQVVKAIEALPRARQLAMSATRARNEK